MAVAPDELEEQAEKLLNAVRALGSLARPPQERLDRALSYFLRTFRNEPRGEAFEHYRRVYDAIGDPPVGTSVCIDASQLAPEALDAVSEALVALHAIIAETAWEARQRAQPAASSARE